MRARTRKEFLKERKFRPGVDAPGFLVVESCVAGFENFCWGDSLDHFSRTVVAEVELVAFIDVLQDVGFALVG